MYENVQPRLRAGHVPAPFGMNAVAPASAVPESDGHLLYNMVAGDRGLKPRPGWQEYAVNLAGAASDEVRTIIPYHGSDPTKHRIFAAMNSGLYDATAGGQLSPTDRVLNFITADVNSGYGSWVHVSALGGEYQFYADETNGLHRYAETADEWSTVGDLTGVDPADLVFVMQWKSFVFFVQKDSANAWYLPAGLISGAAIQIPFTSLFRTGGTLVGLWSWTIDGGTGLDDYLVAISSTGDVVIFAGTDPSSAETFKMVGSWSTGGVPAGRRIATQHGGDIFLLTLFGILPLSKLVGGALVTSETYETYKIRPLFQDTLVNQQNLRGWEMVIHPQDNFLLLNTPGAAGLEQEQYAMSYATQGWSILRGLPILSAGIWKSKLYFGTRDGRVCVSQGGLDNVGYDGSKADARQIESGCLARFDLLGSSNKKMVKLIRPLFVTHGSNPSVKTFARYDFDVQDLTGTATFAVPGADAWDSAIWDISRWSATFGTYKTVQGASGGLGSAVAIGVLLKTQDYCALVGFDVVWEEGGWL